MTPVSVAVGARETTARIYGAGSALLVLAHGAGAGQDHPFLVRYAEGLAARGLAVATFDFCYVAEGRRVPDRMPQLVECYRAVVAAVRAPSHRRLVAGGKSMGGRAASMIAADDPGFADALVFLGYPLHPAKRPEQQRAAHLPRIAVPLLFVQGERDALGTPAELGPIVAGLPRARLLVVEGGDHSLTVPKRKRPQAEVDREVQDAIAAFAQAPG